MTDQRTNYTRINIERAGNGGWIVTDSPSEFGVRFVIGAYTSSADMLGALPEILGETEEPQGSGDAPSIVETIFRDPNPIWRKQTYLQNEKAHDILGGDFDGPGKRPVAPTPDFSADAFNHLQNSPNTQEAI